MKIGIFYGSDTGNVKKIALNIHRILSYYFITDIFDISNCTINDFLNYDVLLLGSSTWYYGELQYDWDNFISNNNKIDELKKIFCIFGCGDQINYKDTFSDGLLKLYKYFISKNCNLIGYWINIGYNFNNSKFLFNKNYFYGLVLDEDNQSYLTDNRVRSWVSFLLLCFYKLKF